jgi:PAS domain S-box-containing protein
VEYRVVRPNGEVRFVHSQGDVTRDESGRPRCIFGTLQDITERKRAEEALRTGEVRFRTIVDHATDAFFLHDAHGTIIDVNRQACESLGYTREELIGMHPSDFDTDVVPPMLTQIGERLEAGEIFAFDTHHRRKDGRVFPVEVRVRPFWEGGTRFGVSLARDITERKRAEEALRRSEAYLAEAQRLSRTGSWAWDVATREFVHWSQEHYRLHGRDPQRGMPSWEEARQFIHPDDRARCLEGIETAIRERTDCVLDYRAVLPDGAVKYIHSIAHPVFNATGELVEFVGTEMDVTERKQAEEALRASLREKEVLLKEVHHRVKNNLQLISSLLALQAGPLKDRAAVDALTESQNRVRSMALVHENLYRSGDLASVRLAGHMESLCAHLFRSYNVDPSRIALDLRVAEVTLDLDRSIRVGLLVNELVSNVLKQAFPAGRTGRALVQLDMPHTGWYILMVSDNGVGLPPHVAPGHSDSLGLQLVADLTEQLGGTLNWDRSGGTTISIRFPAGRREESRS